MISPVVIFAYNRASHLKTTLQHLEACSLSEETVVYIFSDGPKENSRDKVDEVRKFIDYFQKENNFKEVQVIKNSTNLGLQNNIINGVGRIIKKFGKVIVVEDDVIVAPYFLKYMNEALDYYQNDPSIFCVGGLTIPIRIPEEYEYDIIKTQRMSSYCWGTWSSRWETIDWDLNKSYSEFRFSLTKRRAFNQWGNDRASMLDDQRNGRVNSWAIRFEFNMFLQDKYCILPVHSLANTIGSDGSGTHNGGSSINSEIWIDCDNIRLHEIVTDPSIMRQYYKTFYSKPYHLLRRYLSNILYTFANKNRR